MLLTIVGCCDLLAGDGDGHSRLADGKRAVRYIEGSRNVIVVVVEVRIYIADRQRSVGNRCTGGTLGGVANLIGIKQCVPIAVKGDSGRRVACSVVNLCNLLAGDVNGHGCLVDGKRTILNRNRIVPITLR